MAVQAPSGTQLEVPIPEMVRMAYHLCERGLPMNFSCLLLDMANIHYKHFAISIQRVPKKPNAAPPDKLDTKRSWFISTFILSERCHLVADGFLLFLPW